MQDQSGKDIQTSSKLSDLFSFCFFLGLIKKTLEGATGIFCEKSCS